MRKEDRLSPVQMHIVIAESLALSTALAERLEILKENGLFIQRTKQAVTNSIAILDNYVSKTFDPTGESEETKNELFKGATIIADFVARINATLDNPDILPLSTRERVLEQYIKATVLFPKQQKELYDKIIESQILNY